MDVEAVGVGADRTDLQVEDGFRLFAARARIKDDAFPFPAFALPKREEIVVGEDVARAADGGLDIVRAAHKRGGLRGVGLKKLRGLEFRKLGLARFGYDIGRLARLPVLKGGQAAPYL